MNAPTINTVAKLTRIVATQLEAICVLAMKDTMEKTAQVCLSH